MWRLAWQGLRSRRASQAVAALAAAALVAAVLATGALTAGAAASHPLTRAEATAAALRALAPPAAAGIVIDGLAQAQAAGTVVGDSGPSQGDPVQTVGGPLNARLRYRPASYTLRAPGWVFWEDFAPDADFSHPSRLLVIDAGDGRVAYSAALGFYPLLDARPAPFVRAELAARYRVFPAALARAARRPAAATPPPERGARAAALGYRPGNCLVTVGDQRDQRATNFGGDVEAIEGAAGKVGIPAYRAEGANVAGAVKDAVEHHCSDIWLFIAGHGLAAPGTTVNGHRVATSNDPTVVITHDSSGDASQVITPFTIVNLRDSYPTVTFKVTVSSCFSGRFVEDLQNDHGIVFVGSSSAANQISYRFPFTYQGKTYTRASADTDLAGSYAYGFAQALEHIDPSSVGYDLAQGLAAAQANTARYGDKAAAAGATTPVAIVPRVISLRVGYGGDGIGGVTLAPTVNGSPCGTLPCLERFASGTEVTVTAQPDAGSYFGGFSGGGCSGGLEPCTITLSADTSIVAYFYRSPRHQLTVTTSGSGSGTVTTGAPYNNPPRIQCPSTCLYVFAAGSVVPLVATPATGSIFAGWGGGCGGTGGCTVTLDADTTVDARFDTAPPTNTTPPANQTYRCTGSQMTLFSNWNGDAVSDGGAPPSFSTSGQAYCLVSISTYHWFDGNGATPGTIGLDSAQGNLGPWPATGSTGSPSATYPGGVPNANWTVTPGSPSQPVVINGTYTCNDSSPATWSQNASSGGLGFCEVIVKTAQG
jgi:hypothetical protein